MKAFVAMPFHSKFHVTWEAIKKACEANGIEVVKVDDLPQIDNIHQTIFDEIDSSDLVIVDFSGDKMLDVPNPNVVTEACHGKTKRKPLVLLTQSTESLPFDWRVHRAIVYRGDKPGIESLHKTLTDNLKALKKRLLEGKANEKQQKGTEGTKEKYRDTLFAHLVLRENLLPEHKLREVRREVKSRKKKGEPITLAALLVKKSLITESQERELRRFLEKQVIRCPLCKVAYQDARKYEEGQKFSCKKCGATIIVKKTFSEGVQTTIKLGSLPQELDVVIPSSFRFLNEATYSCGNQTQTVKEYLHEPTDMEFVFIPGMPCFINGGDKEERVYVSPYLIGKYSVTQKIWKNVMGTGPWEGRHHVKKGPDYPVTYVTWEDAKRFCHKMGLSLPTEVQWEAACRAGTTTKFYWGDSFSIAYSFFKDNSKAVIHPVGRKASNAFGLYDMAGNIWEWCEDWHGDDYPSGIIDPTGPSAGSCRVRRGGSYLNGLNQCQSGYRNFSEPNECGHRLGFRVCLSLK